jgi:hypothetical protein
VLISSAVALMACNFPIVQTPVPTATHTPTIYVSPTPTDTPTGTPQPTLTPLPPTAFLSATPPPSDTPQPTETPVPTLDMPYGDVSYLLQGVCFKYMATLVDQALTFNAAGELAALYGRVDTSKACYERMSRQTFDFTNKQIVGTVISGQGCGLVVTYLRTDLDDNAKTRKIILSADSTGDCDYALLQPLLLSVDRIGYTTQVVITSP